MRPNVDLKLVCQSTLTLVFVPLCRLITDLGKSSGIPFFFIAPSNTFLLHFFYSVKSFFYFHRAHMQLFSCSSCCHRKINAASIVPISGLKPLFAFHLQSLLYEALFLSTFDHLHSMIMMLHSSIAAAVPDINLPP